jgi:hypothetical protein
LPKLRSLEAELDAIDVEMLIDEDAGRREALVAAALEPRAVFAHRTEQRAIDERMVDALSST